MVVSGQTTIKGQINETTKGKLCSKMQNMNMFMWKGFHVTFFELATICTTIKLMYITHIVSSSLAMSCHKFSL